MAPPYFFSFEHMAATTVLIIYLDETKKKWMITGIVFVIKIQMKGLPHGLHSKSRM
jgi:hypothetical protein